MKQLLLVIGKTEQKWVKDAIALYMARLKHYIPFSYKEIPDIKRSGNIQPAELKKVEGVAILKHLDPSDVLILLDEQGKEYNSISFAGFQQEFMNRSVRSVVYVIGGAWGFSEEVYKRAQQKISLSQLTFNHELVRVIFLEQLYRAYTIIKGEPYHHR